MTNTTKEYQERLLCEFRDLTQKRFILSRTLENSNEFDEKQYELLKKQHEAMLQYEEILYIRILDIMK